MKYMHKLWGANSPDVLLTLIIQTRKETKPNIHRIKSLILTWHDRLSPSNTLPKHESADQTGKTGTPKANTVTEQVKLATGTMFHLQHASSGTKQS
jgi:hypothetical protein